MTEEHRDLVNAAAFSIALTAFVLGCVYGGAALVGSGYGAAAGGVVALAALFALAWVTA